ncbi:TIGR02594 family protein [Prosthecobacter dejongeii]|uniref:Uncharacterized protein (TIGR02594 family) n=1 Tax=Prosthecobacter dejongeii TaxID=48465 RepID=A0A7W8DQ24_9BACT|nr:TIGR02594 family protein [Prosthecobacter dejongeii]MBB5038284.1 uncharacterized protein (TIGR02594 family) [Prosthecobacter dejongeii]
MSTSPPSSSARLFAAALRYLGTKEVPGAGSNPKIKAWIKEAATWLNGDDSKTAWCGCFRGGVGLETATGVPPEHYRAAEWGTWGKAVDLKKPQTWQRGDTIVMTRPGGNHVCLLDRIEGRTAYCLGGNQADSVSIAPFPISRITHVRRLS